MFLLFRRRSRQQRNAIPHWHNLEHKNQESGKRNLRSVQPNRKFEPVVLAEENEMQRNEVKTTTKLTVALSSDRSNSSRNLGHVAYNVWKVIKRRLL